MVCEKSLQNLRNKGGRPKGSKNKAKLNVDVFIAKVERAAGRD
jgi:hypothetical protein